MDIEKLVELVEAQRQEAASASYVVGINGLDGAGKTTLAEHLLEKLPGTVQLLHVDDFNNSAFQQEFYARYCELGVAAGELDRYYSMSVNYAELERAIVAARQQSALVIVEGVFLYKPPLSQHIDFSIFIDCSFQLARQRYAKRRIEVNDTRPLSVFDDIWWPAYTRYIEECNVLAFANLVIHPEEAP